MKNRMIMLALTSLVMLSVSCGNANANNDEKKQKNSTENVKTAGAKELTTAEFNKVVYDTSKEDLKYLGSKPAIVDFTAKWCGPCQKLAPILDELAKEYDGKIVVYKVDIDKNRELAEAFGISSIPAILYIPMDDAPSITVGYRDKEKFRKEIATMLLKKK